MRIRAIGCWGTPFNRSGTISRRGDARRRPTVLLVLLSWGVCLATCSRVDLPRVRANDNIAPADEERGLLGS